MLSRAAQEALRSYTPARVALESAGISVATRPLLDFQLAHAQARDAVHAAIDVRMLCEELRRCGLPALALQSSAGDRATYLRRPDLGRVLSQDSLAQLTSVPCDVVFVIADGLSALAVERHAVHLMRAMLPLLSGQRLAPVCVVEQGRVAIGDAIGAALEAPLAVVMIGERPGLSSPDSLGVYITWDPRPGRKDAERNCISNIREDGLSYDAAASRLRFYMQEAARRQMTGVALKDPSEKPAELL
ncbi:MAG: ethanolamine ammonia-lyase subunit EutC [Acidobacteriaceae bacterium]